MKNKLFSIIVLSLTISFFSCTRPSSNIDTSLIPVKSGDKWGYINVKGTFVINPQFEYAGFFRDGIAKIMVKNKTGYINKKG